MNACDFKNNFSSDWQIMPDPGTLYKSEGVLFVKLIYSCISRNFCKVEE